MKQIKKALALLLGAVLLLGLLPAAALAAEEDFVTRVDIFMMIYEQPIFGFSGKTSSDAAPFTDLEGCTDEQINVLAVLKEAGVIAGYEDGKVDPFRSLPRCEAVLLMWRLAGGALRGDPAPLPYKDVSEDDDIYGGYLYHMFSSLYAMGILTDEDMDGNGNFRPYDDTTAAEAEAWLKKFVKDIEENPPEEPQSPESAPSGPAASDPAPSDPAGSDPAPAELTPQGLAEELHSLGLFRGMDDTGKNFELDRAANRVEGMVMLIRILGREQTALSGSWSHPFQDVPAWADNHIGYAYETGLTPGISDTEFDSVSAVTVNMYLTYVLRALGYSDAEGDFDWRDPYALAAQAGVLPKTVDRENFLRADMVVISAAALGAALKDSEQTLAEKLAAEGVFTQAQYNAAALIHRVRTELL